MRSPSLPATNGRILALSGFDTTSDGPLKDKLEAKIALYDEAARLDAQLIERIKSAAGVEKLRKLEEHPTIAIGAADRVSVAFALALRQASITKADLQRAKEQLTTWRVAERPPWHRPKKNR